MFIQILFLKWFNCDANCLISGGVPHFIIFFIMFVTMCCIKWVFIHILFFCLLWMINVKLMVQWQNQWEPKPKPVGISLDNYYDDLTKVVEGKVTPATRQIDHVSNSPPQLGLLSNLITSFLIVIVGITLYLTIACRCVDHFLMNLMEELLCLNFTLCDLWKGFPTKFCYNFWWMIVAVFFVFLPMSKTYYSWMIWRVKEDLRVALSKCWLERNCKLGGIWYGLTSGCLMWSLKWWLVLYFCSRIIWTCLHVTLFIIYIYSASNHSISIFAGSTQNLPWSPMAGHSWGTCCSQACSCCLFFSWFWCWVLSGGFALSFHL